MPVHDGREVSGALARDLPDDVLGDRGECNVLVHGEQRQPVAHTGRNKIIGNGLQLRLARGEPRDARARQDSYEWLGVG